MKSKTYLLALLCFLFGQLRTFAQETIVTIKYEKIKKKVTGSFTDKKNIIVVSFKNAADLKKHTKDLLIATNPKKLSDKTTMVTGTKPDVQKFQLSYDLSKYLDIKTETYNFVFALKGMKAADLVLKLGKAPAETPVPQKPSGGDDADADKKPPVYNPILPPGAFDILRDINVDAIKNKALSNPVVFVPDANDYALLNNIVDKDVNEVIYSFCDNKIYYKKNGNKSFRPKVGTPLTVKLTTIPNPTRYDVTIKSTYLNYNTKPDSFLNKYLLNSVSASSIVAQAGGVSDDADLAIHKKNVLLGYLQNLQIKLQSFMDDNFNKLDCIDATVFNNQRDKIKTNINEQLLAYDPTYPGDLLVYIQDQFSPADSNYVNPVTSVYKIFIGIKVAPYIYQIPQLDNADEVLVNMSIKPKANSGATRKVDSLVIDLHVFGGFKVDFSPGFFYNSFSSPQYSLRADSTVTTTATGKDTTTRRYKTIVTEKKKGYEMGFASYMHFYTRTGDWFNVSGTIGAGLTIDDKPMVRYLLGGSMIFGRNARISLNGGYSIGQVNQLSNQYQNMQAPLSDTGPATVKTWAHGYFIGISYNIPLYKKTDSTAK